MEMGKKPQRIKLIWISQFLSIINTSKNNKERMHMEHSPLWNTHFLQGGCLCQRYTACTQTHSPRLPAASAAQIPPPLRCVRRTHTHHTPSRLRLEAQRNTNSRSDTCDTAHAEPLTYFMGKANMKVHFEPRHHRLRYIDFHSYKTAALPLWLPSLNVQGTWRLLGHWRHETAAR